MGRQRNVLAGLGMAHFVEQHGSNQHRVDPLAAALGDDQRPQIGNPPEGVGAQGLQLVNAAGEELGQAGLGAMHPKATLQLEQLGR